MTTTPELHTLAQDPCAFDSVLAALHGKREGLRRTVESLVSKLHSMEGDRKSYRGTRVPVWGMSDREVEQAAQRKAAHNDDAAILVIRDLAATRAVLAAVDFEIANMDAVYARTTNRWTRFFPSITKSHPHIHRSLQCRTLHWDTQMSWAPELSGRTDEEAVAELDEALCSVCFPDAPVALHNYVSRKSQAAQDERAAEKRARDDTKAAKRLTEDEQFRTVGTFKDRVETVAKCKELVREHPKAIVELEWTRANGARIWTDPADLARVIRNREDKVAESATNAKAAERVLLARESRQEGFGATMEDIEKMRATALKTARKEWAKN